MPVTEGANAQSVPVITVDGPGGSGKGTVSRRVAERLGWHFLDSGVLYRAVALASEWRGIDDADADALAQLAAELDVRFAVDGAGAASVWVEGREATRRLGQEDVGGRASRVAALPAVREALLSRQRDFRQSPGLVADGRDMGTVVFPDACCKIFLSATAEERARRRLKQLNEQGVDATLDRLLAEIRARDERDRTRAVAPLVPSPDAVVIDTTDVPVADVVERVLRMYREGR